MTHEIPDAWPHASVDGVVAVKAVEKTDKVLKALRGNLKRFWARHRQGALDRRAMTPPECADTARYLREAAERHVPLPIACCIGALTNLSPTVVPNISLSSTVAGASSCLRVVLPDGIAVYDLDLVLERCAKPKQGCVPATRRVEVRLPAFLVGVLSARQRLTPDANSLQALIGQPDFEGRKGLFPGAGHRLNHTLARFRRALGPMLLDHGVSPIAASAALLDFSLVNRSNFAYLTIPAAEFDEAVATLHSILNWD